MNKPIITYMLSPSGISQKEIDKILETMIEKSGISNESRAIFNSEKFKLCPAAISNHSNFEGGLIVHSYNVGTRFSKLLSEQCLNIGIEKVNPWKVALCHDLCKTLEYSRVSENEWKREDPIIYGHGNASVIICSMGNVNIKLTPWERICIMWHMGIFTYDGCESAFEKACTTTEQTAYLMHIADNMASKFDEISIPPIVQKTWPESR